MKTLAALRREIKKADVVLAHGSTALPACAIASVGPRAPFIYRQISDSRFWAPSGFRRARVRAALSRAAAIVALWEGSAETLHHYLGVPRSRIRVIPNGAEAANFAPPSAVERAEARVSLGLATDRFTVVYVGALVPEKGVDRLVRAAAELPELQFLVAGDGPQRLELDAGVDPDGAPVTFAGSLDDATAAYRAADLFVLPSRGGDSMPAVLIEAGLCGVPCVSTDIEAIPEVVLDGTSGRILARDDDKSWVDVIATFAADPAAARRMGAAARAHCVERFDIDVVAGDWLAAIDAL